MADCFIGEIRMFAGNYAPEDWALCNGQLMDINQNNALYSLLGVTYGGNGSSNFNLPDMRGRVPMHRGQGTGLTPRTIGQTGGVETVSLSLTNLPQHNHTQVGSSSVAASTTAATNLIGSTAATKIYDTNALDTKLIPMNTTFAVSNEPLSQQAVQAHNNLAPYFCVNFIISLAGLYPSRN